MSEQTINPQDNHHVILTIGSYHWAFDLPAARVVDVLSLIEFGVPVRDHYNGGYSEIRDQQEVSLSLVGRNKIDYLSADADSPEEKSEQE